MFVFIFSLVNKKVDFSKKNYLHRNSIITYKLTLQTIRYRTLQTNLRKLSNIKVGRIKGDA